MKVSPKARRLAKYKELKKEFSVATLQFDVTFCAPIPCAPSMQFSNAYNLKCIYSCKNIQIRPLQREDKSELLSMQFFLRDMFIVDCY